MSNTQYCTHTGDSTVCDACMGQPAKMPESVSRCHQLEPLTRGQVEDICRDLTYDAQGDSVSVNHLQYTDATLRAELAAMTARAEEAETSIAFDKVTCLMTMNKGLNEDVTFLKQQLTEAQQEITRLRGTLLQIANTAHENDHLHTLIGLEDVARRALAGTKEGAGAVPPPVG